MITRYTSSVGSAISITFLLLFLMQLLIDMGKDAPIELPDRDWDDHIRVFKPDEPADREKEVEPPPEVEIQPPPPSVIHGEIDPSVIRYKTIETPPNIELPNIGAAIPSGDLVVVMQVMPMYPRRARDRGIEGYVVVGFTVTELGAVADAMIIESSNSLLNKAALQAIAKFKYKPRVVDGRPIAVSGQQRLFSFELED